MHFHSALRSPRTEARAKPLMRKTCIQRQDFRFGTAVGHLLIGSCTPNRKNRAGSENTQTIPPYVDLESCRSPAKEASWNKPSLESHKSCHKLCSGISDQALLQFERGANIRSWPSLLLLRLDLEASAVPMWPEPDVENSETRYPGIDVSAGGYIQYTGAQEQ